MSHLLACVCSEVHQEHAGVLCRTTVQINEGKYVGARPTISDELFSDRGSLCGQGLGTTDSALVRIMVSRAEIDMLDIKAEFMKMYGKTLYSFIKVRPEEPPAQATRGSSTGGPTSLVSHRCVLCPGRHIRGLPQDPAGAVRRRVEGPAGDVWDPRSVPLCDRHISVVEQSALFAQVVN